jgi:hypothetical protein
MIDILQSQVLALYETVAYRARLVAGEYALALRHIDASCSALEASITAIDAAPDPTGARRWMVIDLWQRKAERADTRALLAREEHRWEDAAAEYHYAWSNWHAAARAALDLPGALGIVFQEQLISKATAVDTSLRQCNAERASWLERLALRAELDNIRAALLEGIRSQGVTNVSTTSEAVNHVQQTSSFVLALEHSVRETAGELLLASQSLNDPAAEQASRLLEQIRNDPEKGPGFLERSKKNVSLLKDIVRDGDAAIGVLSPLLKILARQLGVPV